MIRVRSLLGFLALCFLALGCGDDSPTKPKLPAPPEPPPPANLRPGVVVGTGALTGNAYALVVGDVNGDSIADIALAGDDQKVWVGLGSHSRVFSGTVVDVGVQANALAIGDLDHDGIDDLVAAGPGAVTWLKGSLGGVSASAETLSVISDAPFVSRLRAGDLTNDGYPEFVLITYYRDTTPLELPHFAARVLTLSGSTSVGPIPGNAELGDVNGDGALDLVMRGIGFVSTDIYVRLGANNGTFPSTGPSRTVSRIVTNQATSDLDGDGTDEIVNQSPVSVPGIAIMAWETSTLGGEEPVNGTPTGSSCVAGDFNRDDKPDLATSAYSSQQVQLLLGNGTRTYVVDDVLNAGDEVLEIAAGDIDGNGKVDLITRGNGAGTLRALYNEYLAEVSAITKGP